jgi:hypothetical protein
LFAALEGTPVKDSFDIDVAGADIIYLIVLGVVYFILIFVIEKFK